MGCRFNLRANDCVITELVAPVSQIPLDTDVSPVNTFVTTTSEVITLVIVEDRTVRAVSYTHLTLPTNSRV